MTQSEKLLVTGAAGLVGQNLIARLKRRGWRNLAAIDKHPANTHILRRLHPDITVIEADLAERGAWEDAFTGMNAVISLHAQIGGLDYSQFVANNITATENVLRAAEAHTVPLIVHASSSVVNSVADDFYTETKEQQEKLVMNGPIPWTVLRPTLMFGWFDRKHLGWLARFMKKVPVFPIPGDGRYMRQPLYVHDFCDIIIACLNGQHTGRAFNITGQEKIDYIDLIRTIKQTTRARAMLTPIPYRLFWLMLKTYAMLDNDPPFTVQQLKALVAPDEFEVIDWPGIFGVPATPLAQALEETYNDLEYSHIVLEF